MENFKRERPFIQGSLFGMAICNALIPRGSADSKQGIFGTETSMTICIARAAIDDGGYQYDKFTYIEKLLEWLKDIDPDERGGYVRRSVALVLNAWDRQQVVASATGNGGKKNEGREKRKDRFEKMRKMIDKEFVVGVGKNHHL